MTSFKVWPLPPFFLLRKTLQALNRYAASLAFVFDLFQIFVLEAALNTPIAALALTSKFQEALIRPKGAFAKTILFPLSLTL